MKKTFNLFALLVMLGLVFAVVACKKTEAPTTEKPTTTQTDKQTDATTTEDPGTTTEDPGSTTEEPGSTTEEPGSTTEDPSSVTEDPGTTTEHTHTWDEGRVTTDPTCTTKGVKTYTCSCGETRTEELEALGHQASTELYHTADKHFNVCTRCGFTLDFQELTVQTDLADTRWTQRKYTTEWVSMSGQMRVREKDGSTVVNMAAGYSTTMQYIFNFEGTTPIAKGNSFSIDLGNYFGGAKPMGVKVSLVVKVGSESQTVYVLGSQDAFYDFHVTTGFETFSYVSDTEVEVYEIRITNNSQNSGNFYLYMDNIKIFTAMNAQSHTLEEDAAVAPTCTEAGKTLGHHCTGCDYKDGGEVVNALGHDKVHHDEVEATCTTDGMDEYTECTRCHKLWDDLDEETTTNVLVNPKLGHNYEWIIDTPATFTQSGLQHEECSRCHDKKNENTVIDKLIGYEVSSLGEHHVDIRVIKTSTGLKIEYKAKEDNNSFGYGACLDLPGTDYSVLLATTGNIAFQAYQNWTWDYKLPSAVGATVSRVQDGEYMVSTFEFADATLGITEETATIGILLFEVVNANGAQYGIYNTESNIAIDGGVSNFREFRFKEEVALVSKDFEAFGQSNATINLSVYASGIRITINSTPSANTFGYGVMFGNLSTNVGTTDLYAIGYGTVDHKTYGDWNWQGNYVAPSTVGIEARETTDGDNKTVVLFYSYETLSALGITKDTAEFGVQFFEYVTGGTANLYENYNCINIDGTPKAFDTGVANFVKITK